MISGYVSVVAPQAIIMGEMEFGGDKSRSDRDENRETYVPTPRKK